ncbi:MAG TPA: toprim domain-containing protein [Gammaproteobacteria bacterium]|nr:toprim domain-containing protein [Gammaproteobacteria bacterium]
MARISDAELERLKTDVSLVTLIERAGVTLSRRGQNELAGRCPLCADASAESEAGALVVTPHLNQWTCTGCHAAGGVLDWVMQREGVSLTHAVELLRRDFPDLVRASTLSGRAYAGPKLDTAFTRTLDDQQLVNRVTDYYHLTLTQSPDALNYLAKRGLTDPAVIDQFTLGYANRTLGYRIPTTKQKGGPALRGQLQRLGLMRASGHEHFTGSLVIPITDAAQQVIGLYGRKITKGLRPGTPLHLYLPDPPPGVFNLDALCASKELILCPSLIDALTFWCAGYRNVTASYGLNGFTQHHLAAFSQYGTERVLIAYPRTEAGDQVAQAIALTLTNNGIECFRLLFPSGMDANDYALKTQPADKSLGALIRKAEWLGKEAAPATVRRAATMDPAVAAGISAESAPGTDVTETGIPDPNPSACVTQTDATPSVAEPAPAKAESENNLVSPREHVASAVTPDPQPATLPSVSPVAVPAPRAEIPAEISENEIVLTLGDRRYRVRGLDKNLSYEVLKVNVLASRGEAFHVDTLDLYSAKYRAGYIKQAAIELGCRDDVIKHDLGKVLLKLEALQEERIQQALAPTTPARAMSVDDERAALDLLTDPYLTNRILSDFAACGVVGEATNLLTSYLACVSRKLDKPLAVLMQSTSAAGKSALLDAVLAMMPDEERILYSAMTGQSLFYLGETDLKHKILALAEEEGASSASYALKLLQSEGVLTIASTGKDPDTGKLVTQAYRVEGPVMLYLTTTAIEIDEELLNRCLVLTVNESREQTRAIHARQRASHTLQGLLSKQDRSKRLTVHRNAQRLLRPVWVANPYAEQLTFLDVKTRTRRDHVKYLTLIRAIALLHQYQREIKTVEQDGERIDYIDVIPADIDLANRLANEVLGRTLDELPPQTRLLLSRLHAYVRERADALHISRHAVRFSRRELREQLSWSDTQLRLHLQRLTELEYLYVHHGERGRRYVYELVYQGEGDDGSPFFPGLVSPAALTDTTRKMADTTTHSRGLEGPFAGSKPDLAGSTRGQNAPFAGGSRSNENPASADRTGVPADPDKLTPKSASTDKKVQESPASHNPVRRSGNISIDEWHSVKRPVVGADRIGG